MSSPKTGTELRDIGTKRVGNKIRSVDVENWKKAFRACIRALAQDGAVFSSDTVRQICPPPTDDPTYHPNLIGGIFLGETRKGTIELIGRSRSEIASRHAANIAQYRGKTK